MTNKSVHNKEKLLENMFQARIKMLFYIKRMFYIHVILILKNVSPFVIKFSFNDTHIYKYI